MPKLTVQVDDRLYADLKELARAGNTSVEAVVKDMLQETVKRRQGDVGVKLADLSGPVELADLETPFVRPADLPRDIYMGN